MAAAAAVATPAPKRRRVSAEELAAGTICRRKRDGKNGGAADQRNKTPSDQARMLSAAESVARCLLCPMSFGQLRAAMRADGAAPASLEELCGIREAAPEFLELHWVPLTELERELMRDGRIEDPAVTGAVDGFRPGIKPRAALAAARGPQALLGKLRAAAALRPRPMPPPPAGAAPAKPAGAQSGHAAIRAAVEHGATQAARAEAARAMAAVEAAEVELRARRKELDATVKQLAAAQAARQRRVSHEDERAVKKLRQQKQVQEAGEQAAVEKLRRARAAGGAHAEKGTAAAADFVPHTELLERVREAEAQASLRRTAGFVRAWAVAKGQHDRGARKREVAARLVKLSTAATAKDLARAVRADLASVYGPDAGDHIETEVHIIPSGSAGEGSECAAPAGKEAVITIEPMDDLGQLRSTVERRLRDGGWDNDATLVQSRQALYATWPAPISEKQLGQVAKAAAKHIGVPIGWVRLARAPAPKTPGVGEHCARVMSTVPRPEEAARRMGHMLEVAVGGDGSATRQRFGALELFPHSAVPVGARSDPVGVVRGGFEDLVGELVSAFLRTPDGIVASEAERGVLQTARGRAVAKSLQLLAETVPGFFRIGTSAKGTPQSVAVEPAAFDRARAVLEAEAAKNAETVQR
eukprot:TRINITY_DN65541_c0_g1_i1.p1 TRINITY_DN65541_c0_g1~~TRINITY_DN65541_c0_g1_i1.p1  ORF type:complete len:643 (+),score=154.16 TRINITY_DN65541_c0_g1_i1:93-2021(+)